MDLGLDLSFAGRKASVMKCLRPVLVRVSNMSHPLLGVTPPGRYACASCEVCCYRWSREVYRRAVREFESTPPGHVAASVTLTFADEFLAGAVSDFGKVRFRRFATSFSKAYRRAYPGVLPVKVLACPELGSLNGRLHIHAVFYSVLASVCDGHTVIEAGGRTVLMSPLLAMVRSLWPDGFVHVDVAHSAAAVGYVTKYALKGRESVAAKLQQHRAAAKRARALGLPVPSFEHAFWMHIPRGRAGGLAGAFADGVGRSQPPVTRLTGELAPLMVGGPNGRRVALSRYESRRARRVAGLDEEAPKLARAARNPEPVEMAFRLEQSGSFNNLRMGAGHVDRVESDHALGLVRLAKSLGRV